MRDCSDFDRFCFLETNFFMFCARISNSLPISRPFSSYPSVLRQRNTIVSSLITRKMSSNTSSEPTERAFPNLTSADPGEKWEPRQTSSTADWKPDPSKSLPLSPARQSLMDDIIALYSCEPTIERVKRYTPDCVYDDQFVYANDRYKMAGQWFALPKLFKASKCEGYQVVVNQRDLIQFKNEQSWTFIGIPKTATINALVSLSLDPDSVDAVDKNGGKGFIQVKYHKDQANEKDYSHEGLGFNFKKYQADKVAEKMDSKEVEQFLPDKKAQKEHVHTHGSGTADAPVKDL